MDWDEAHHSPGRSSRMECSVPASQSQQFGLFWYWTPGWHCWSNWPMQSRSASWPHNNEDKWDVCVVIPPPGASQELPCRLHRHLPSYPVNAIPRASLLIWWVKSAPGTLSSAADIPDECSPGHIPTATHSWLSTLCWRLFQSSQPTATRGCTPKVSATLTPSSTETRGAWHHSLGKQQLDTMASKFILGSGACSIQRLSASPGEVCHRCANISRWQCASTTSTPGACHCAGLTGKWRIHSCCCGDNLWNKPSIVVQFSSADGQFGGWISMLVTVLFWYCSNHIRYASRVGDRVTPGAAGCRRSRRQKSSNSNSLEKPNRIAISWSSSFIVWIQLRKHSSVNLPTSRSTHHLWRSIRLQWFSVDRLHCQQAISGVKYHGKCSISTCLFTECTSLPHMGHDRILVETEGAGPVAGGVCGDEFITAEAAVCVGKSTTWGTSSDAIAVEPINGGAIICACVGGFIPAEAAVCGGKSTTWGASSDAVAVELFTGGATICACVGRFLGAPCSALKLIESTSLTGASFSAPDENTTASADSDAAADTVSGPIRTIRSTSRERTTLVLICCCVRMVIVWRPPTSYGTGLRCCLRSPRLRVLSGWKCPLDWPELICGGPRASPRVSWCQRSSHHRDVRFSFASCWRWYGWARFLGHYHPHASACCQHGSGKVTFLALSFQLKERSPACCLLGSDWSFPYDTFPSLYSGAPLNRPLDDWLERPGTPACCLVGSDWTIASLYPYSVFAPPGHQNPDELTGHVPENAHA